MQVVYPALPNLNINQLRPQFCCQYVSTLVI